MQSTTIPLLDVFLCLINGPFPLSVCLFVHPSIYLFVHPSFTQSASSLSVCLFVSQFGPVTLNVCLYECHRLCLCFISIFLFHSFCSTVLHLKCISLHLSLYEIIYNSQSIKQSYVIQGGGGKGVSREKRRPPFARKNYWLKE